MGSRVWLLDVAEGEGFEILLWCKAEDSSIKLAKLSYTPSFYLVGNLDRAQRYLGSEAVRFERCRRRVRGAVVDALKVYSPAEDQEEYAEKLVKRLGGVEAYEADLRPSIKFLLDSGLKPSSWIEVDGEPAGSMNQVEVIELRSFKQLEHAPPPSLLAMSINPIYFSERGSPSPERDPVRLISICFSDGESYQLDGPEAEILGGLLEIVERKDPDVIVGFGLNRGQWDYLAKRAELSGLKLKIGRLGSEPRTSVYGHISIRGRLNIDLEDMARDIPELTVETLEEFIGYLGIERRLVVIEEHELAEAWSRDPDLVKRYSMQRAEAILEAYKAVKDFIFSLSELTQMPADYVLTASAGFRVESYLMGLAEKIGELIPRRREVKHVSYLGGLVKAPKRGIHEDVAVVDFRSMYPSLMIKYNISFDTLSPDGENIAPNGHRFKAEPEGFLPHALKALLDERRKIQGRLKELDPESVEARVLDARQRAVKLIANAIYGYTGWIGARWYTREVAEATAAWGREVIASSMKKAEELGMRVIYSDTDSLFLKGYKDKIEKLLSWIEEDLGLEAKIEKIYKRVIFTEAKKKYAGLTTDGRIEIAGLEAVRGDWSQAARDAQRDVLEALLRTGDPGEALRKARAHIRRLLRRELEPRKLVIWKQITRPLDEYSATQPHIVVARMMIEKGWRVQPGDKVGYIVVSGSGPLYGRVKPYFEVEADEIDWSYYIEKQVLPACGRVLSAVGVKPEELKQVSEESTLTEFF